MKWYYIRKVDEIEVLKGDAEALPNYSAKFPQRWPGGYKLDWDWFNPLDCWRDLHGLWGEWKFRSCLMHHSWTSKRLKEKQERDNEERPNGPDLHGIIVDEVLLVDPVKSTDNMV